LGPVIQAGCGAICPAVGYACEGCRGFVPNANMVSIRSVLAEHGMPEHEIDARLTVFLTYQKEKAAEEES
jgi:sulfhydrogenase subunit delta